VYQSLISAGPKAREDGKADGIQVIQNAAPVVQLVAAGDQQHVIRFAAQMLEVANLALLPGRLPARCIRYAVRAGLDDA
jgi:hypothetical protein